MSQEEVESLLGRLITDEQSQRMAADSMEAACMHEGYSLSPAELRMLSGLELHRIAQHSGLLHPGGPASGRASVAP